MNHFRTALAAAEGYLLGSVSTAALFSGFIYKNDVRPAAGRNTGAASIARAFGMRSGLPVPAGDVLKTASRNSRNDCIRRFLPDQPLPGAVL